MIRDVMLATDNESVGLLMAVAENAREAWEDNGTDPRIATIAERHLLSELVDVLERFQWEGR